MRSGKLLLVSLIYLLLFLNSGHSIAQSISSPTPLNNTGRVETDTFISNVHVPTGRLFFSETDLAVDSPGTPIIIERSYNSTIYPGPAPIQAFYSNNPLGKGWMLSVWMRLSEESDGTVTLLDDNGAIFIFSKTSDGTYVSPPGFYGILSKANSKFNLRTKENLFFTFSSNGYLLSIHNLRGLSLGFAYDASNRIIEITDTLGKKTVFTYQDIRLASIQSPSGFTVSYSYDAQNRLIRKTDTFEMTRILPRSATV